MSHSKKIIIFSAVLFFLAGVFTWFKYGNSFYRVPQDLKIPVPTIIVANPNSTDLSDVHSPNGKKKFIMKKTSNQDGSARYTFFVSDIAGADQKEIFSKTETEDYAISIPQNTFSPDNKYVFLKEQNANGIVAFPVFKVSGEPFANGDIFIDVVSLFISKNNNYILKDVTGWDSDALMNVLTQKEDGKRGPLFWFDVINKSFIQLAR